MTVRGTIARERGGVVAEEYRLYRVVGQSGGEPASVMPRPASRAR